MSDKPIIIELTLSSCVETNQVFKGRLSVEQAERMIELFAEVERLIIKEKATAKAKAA